MHYFHHTCETSHASSAQTEFAQQHDHCRDPTDTIVKTRAQRAHRGQSGNNLQAGQTSNDPQAEASTVAAPPQLIMAAAPPANPAPQAPAFVLGPGWDNTVLDWSFPADTKLNYKAIVALDSKFDGTPEKFIAFLASITSQA